MIVESRTLLHRPAKKHLAAVARGAHEDREKISLVGIVGLHRHSRVISGPRKQVAVGVDELPVFPAVVGAPQNSRIGGRTIPWNTAPGFDQGINTAGVGFGHRQARLAKRPLRQAMPGKAIPCHAAVCGFPDAASRPSADASPGVDFDLPHGCEENVGMIGVHHDVGGTGILVDEQNAAPRFAAVAGPVDTALLLWAIAVTERSGQNYIRVARIDDDAANAPRLFKAHARPGFTGILGLEYPPAHGDVAANKGFPGSRPHDIRVRGRQRQRADGGRRLIVEDGLPVNAPVGGLPYSSGGRTHVVGGRIARDSGHGNRAIAWRPEIAIMQRRVSRGIDLPGRRGKNEDSRKKHQPRMNVN